MIMLEKIKYYTRENQYGNESEYAEFDGIEFYKNEEYYLHNTYGYLHRYIYEYFYGPIQSDYYIHHINHIKSNNNINNLTMLTKAEHTALHMKGNKFGLGNKNMFGKKHTDEAKEKMSKAKKGKNFSDEHKQKISKTHKGENNYNYKQRTTQMYEDVKNDMGPTEFKKKYNCSTTYYYNTKKELEAGLYN